MDIFNLTMKIPYVLMLMVGVTLTLQLYVGGLNSLSIDVNSYNEGKYRSAVVLENTLSVQERQGEINYSYDHRRAVTPIEFFTETAMENGDGTYTIGHRENDNGDCYIPRVAGLDGENFGYYIKTTAPDATVDLDCNSITGIRQEAVFSPILLERSGDPVPARLYIYEK